MSFFTTAAPKAQVAALIAFLGPIATYLVVTGEWSWRALAGAVVSGLIAGLTVFQVPYKLAGRREPQQHLRNRHHEGDPR